MIKEIKKPKTFFNLRKVKNIDPLKYSRIVFDYNPVEYKPDGTVEERLKTISAFCSLFGCGKKLSLVEQLCGNRCLKHQGEAEDINYLSS